MSREDLPGDSESTEGEDLTDAHSCECGEPDTLRTILWLLTLASMAAYAAAFAGQQ